MKLVNIHKHTIIIIFLFLGIKPVGAQVWSLQQCIDTAQVRNKNLQIGKNNMLISEQKEKESKANLLPKITANADYKYFTNLPFQLLPLAALNPTAPAGVYREAQFGVPHNINANIQLSMTLYNPQVYGAIQTTKIVSDLSDLQYQKTEEQIFFEISNLYYNAQILYHQIAFIDSNLINAESLLKNVQLLNQQLLAKGTDVSKIKLQISQLNTQKETIKSKYNQVLNALKFAMGISIAQVLEIDVNIAYQTAKEYKTQTTLETRITKTQNSLLHNELNTLNKSRFLPSLNLIGLYGTSGFGYNGEPKSFLNFYPVGFGGIQLSYPLFNGTVTQRKINQKKIELKNNELLLKLNTEQNNLLIENAKLQITVAKKALETTTEQIELAKAIYSQTIQQQKQGTANLNDALTADNALREAQQLYLSAIIEYLKADLELKKQAGQFKIKN